MDLAFIKDIWWIEDNHALSSTTLSLEIITLLVKKILTIIISRYILTNLIYFTYIDNNMIYFEWFLIYISNVLIRIKVDEWKNILELLILLTIKHIKKMGLLELTRTLRKILMSSSIKIAISAKYIMAMNANKCDFMALLQ